jgi:vacuolar-type H+-ATPase subunit F/Vma7
MTKYAATIAHSSIAGARQIEIDGTLAQAKRAASAEFGQEQQDYRIVIIDERGDTAASRRVGDQRWM